MTLADPFSDDPASEAIARHFERERASAPPVPAALSALARRGLLRRLVPLFVGAAAVLLIAIGLGMLMPRRSLASAEEVLQRAAARYSGLEDATLQMRVSSEAIDLLGKLFADEKDEPKTFAPVLWVRLRSPNLFLMYFDVPGAPQALANQKPFAGFDGTLGWTYAEDGNVAEIQDIWNADELDSLALTRLFTFDLVRELQKDRAPGSLREITSPFERRVGRRSFELVPEDQKDGDTFWSAARITVDPETDLVERLELKLSVGPVSILDTRMEIESVNDGLAPETFTFDRNVPMDATLVPGAVHVTTRATPAPDDATQPAPVNEPPASRVAGAHDEPRVADARDEPHGANAAVEARVGLRFAVLESYLRRRIVSTRTPFGLKIAAVAPDSAAARAGLKPGDLLMRWNDQPVETPDQVLKWLDAVRGDEGARIEIARLKEHVSFWSRRPWENIELELRPNGN